MFPVIYAEEVGPVEIGAADAVEIVPEVGRVAVGREYQLALARKRRVEVDHVPALVVGTAQLVERRGQREEQRPVGEGRTLWLRFEGVNRKGTVRLNGHQLGHLDGFMQPGDYDITRLVTPDGENRLEVEVEWVGYPVPNFRSPTYISSAGWDWMPYAPGLLSGITDDVYLSLSGDVRLVEPWVRTKVPDREHAKVELLTDVENRSDKACEGVLRGEIRPGGIAFSHPVRLEAGERRTIRLTEREVPGLAVEHPQLWWPNGMGDPALYTCRLVFETDGRQSDARTVTFGIREYGYEWHDGIFRLKINGEPVYVKGGNWGMSEWLLRCRGEEYDTRVALHRHMHFNMIRNWIGSTTDEEFYDACDRHGIMIWDDFWLNSHPNLPSDRRYKIQPCDHLPYY